MSARSMTAARRGRHWGLWLALACLCLGAPTLSVGAQTQLVIVSGLGGEPKYRDAFLTWSAALAEAAHARFGIPDSAIVWLGEDSTHTSPRYRGRSTRENIVRGLERVGSRAGAGGQVVVVLIGHGAGEGAESRLSIPGPDITAAELAKLLDRLPTRKVAVIALASASGDMLPVLARADRVVITATRTAFERNESQFARHFVEALARDGADVDKDGRVSLLEAFRYAAAETKRFYEDGGRLQTEHAQLDDTGSGRGSADPDGRTGAGVLARRFFLDGGQLASNSAGAADPQLARLYGDKLALEQQIDELRRRKASMTAEAYDDELERLLVTLARNAREIRRLEGRS